MSLSSGIVMAPWLGVAAALFGLWQRSLGTASRRSSWQGSPPPRLFIYCRGDISRSTGIPSDSSGSLSSLLPPRSRGTRPAGIGTTLAIQ